MFTLVLEYVNRSACLNRCRLTAYCEWHGIVKLIDFRLKIATANKHLLFFLEGGGRGWVEGELWIQTSLGSPATRNKKKNGLPPLAYVTSRGLTCD